MPTNYPISPDTPLPISMLPSVETPTENDLLLVTQPGQPQGQRSKSMTLGQVKGYVLPDNSVTTNKLANNAVTTDKLANNAVTTDKLAGGGVTTDKLANNAVTRDKLAYDARTGIIDSQHETSVSIDSATSHAFLASIQGKSGAIIDFSLGFTFEIPGSSSNAPYGFIIEVRHGVSWASGILVRKVYVAASTPGSVNCRIAFYDDLGSTIQVHVVKATTSDGPVASPSYFNVKSIWIEGVQHGLPTPTP